MPYGYRERIEFLCNLASTAKQESFGRAGLMALAVCIASAAGGAETPCEAQWHEDGSWNLAQVESSEESLFCSTKKDLLDILRLIIEGSKQHFNPNYRRKGL